MSALILMCFVFMVVAVAVVSVAGSYVSATLPGLPAPALLWLAGFVLVE